MKCDVGRSCEDEIIKYLSESYMPDNQNKFQKQWWVMRHNKITRWDSKWFWDGETMK